MMNGICEVVLTCSVDGGGNNVTYTWMPLQNKAVMSQGKSHLNVSWESGEHLPNFTCTAHNPVSNSSSQFSSGTICSGLSLPLLLPLPFHPGYRSWDFDVQCLCSKLFIKASERL
jgi:hypothetical protein